MKLNNKGFTVIELLASFTLTMIIVVFLFEIVLELKDVYINEAIKTQVINKNSIVASNLNKKLSSKHITNVTVSGNKCTITYLEGAASTDTITVTNQYIQINNQKISLPEEVTIEDISLVADGPFSADSSGVNDNSYLKISYSITSDILTKELPFTYVYSFHK